MAIELDRIETKIQALIEMGVSRQDPDDLSHQVTAAAESMQQTEDSRESAAAPHGARGPARGAAADSRRRTSAGWWRVTDSAREVGWRTTSPTPSAPTTALPAWYPPWARTLAELYFSGTTSMFVLHGNTFDLVRCRPRRGRLADYGSLADFLAEQLFGRWDLVLHYDLARGLRSFAGANEKRLKEMVATATKWHRRPADRHERSDERHAACSTCSCRRT